MNFTSSAYDQTCAILLTGRLPVVWQIRACLSKKDKGKTYSPSDYRRAAINNWSRLTPTHRRSQYFLWVHFSPPKNVLKSDSCSAWGALTNCKFPCKLRLKFFYSPWECRCTHCTLLATPMPHPRLLPPGYAIMLSITWILYIAQQALMLIK